MKKQHQNKKFITEAYLDMSLKETKDEITDVFETRLKETKDKITGFVETRLNETKDEIKDGFKEETAKILQVVDKIVLNLIRQKKIMQLISCCTIVMKAG